jgi:hypothetical protein
MNMHEIFAKDVEQPTTKDQERKYQLKTSDINILVLLQKNMLGRTKLKSCSMN